ncbi:hypothetical protein B5S31_g941 [[Candida] boidinii]|nr:hypothetical protein B5S29_g898 [[Candida] boidinii]OWB71255.1 hypothetical protein B5S31_g941 [[Candida] boidinii]OWB77170.1 hypothetical protein B5S32_g1331 [[Candida] boidinii]
MSEIRSTVTVNGHIPSTEPFSYFEPGQRSNQPLGWFDLSNPALQQQLQQQPQLHLHSQPVQYSLINNEIYQPQLQIGNPPMDALMKVNFSSSMDQFGSSQLQHPSLQQSASYPGLTTKTQVKLEDAIHSPGSLVSGSHGLSASNVSQFSSAFNSVGNSLQSNFTHSTVRPSVVTPGSDSQSNAASIVTPQYDPANNTLQYDGSFIPASTMKSFVKTDDSAEYGPPSSRLNSASSIDSRGSDYSPINDYSSSIVTVPGMNGLNESSLAAKKKAATRRRLSQHQKLAHNKIEKRYRININAKIAGLQKLVPWVSGEKAAFEVGDPEQDNFKDEANAGQRLNKSMILDVATNYLIHLKSENKKNALLVKELKEKLAKFEGKSTKNGFENDLTNKSLSDSENTLKDDNAIGEDKESQNNEEDENDDEDIDEDKDDEKDEEK